MNTTTIVKYIISASVFTVIDAIYLSFMKNYFNNLVVKIQSTSIKFRYLGAIVTYAFLTFALYYYILSDYSKTLLDAFILGLVIYAVYEFTNYTIFTGWNIETVIIDTSWGAILFVLTTFISRQIYKQFQI